jgi:hypothetical protein
VLDLRGFESDGTWSVVREAAVHTAIVAEVLRGL